MSRSGLSSSALESICGKTSTCERWAMSAPIQLPANARHTSSCVDAIDAIGRVRAMNRVQRRQVLLAAGALLLLPATIGAQRGTKPYRIGFLAVEPDETLRLALRELGYVEGRDIILDVRSTKGRQDRLDEFTKDLVRLNADVIVALYPAA